MTATRTPNQPTTGTDRAAGSRPSENSPSIWTNVLAAIIIAAAIIGGVLLGSYLQRDKDNSRFDRQESEHTAELAKMAAQSREIEVDTVQRELRAYANIMRLPVSNITVTRNDAGDMMATWQQDFQTCTLPVLQPVNGSTLWTTLKAKAGSGACKTDSGSGGIGNGQPVKPGG